MITIFMCLSTPYQHLNWSWSRGSDNFLDGAYLNLYSTFLWSSIFVKKPSDLIVSRSCEFQTTTIFPLKALKPHSFFIKLYSPIVWNFLLVFDQLCCNGIFSFRNNTELATENHVDELKVQIFARDETILKLEQELKKKTEQYHSALHEMSHTGEIVHSVRSKLIYEEQIIPWPF